MLVEQFCRHHHINTTAYLISARFGQHIGYAEELVGFSRHATKVHKMAVRPLRKQADIDWLSLEHRRGVLVYEAHISLDSDNRWVALFNLL